MAGLQDVQQALLNQAAGSGDFLTSLIGTESGGNWSAQNDEIGAGGQAGHFGRLQFGQARLQDAKNAGIIPAGMTPTQFMADPSAQQAVESWHFSDIDNQAAKMGLNSYIGQTIGGAKITPAAIRAMAHLGGIGGAAKFLNTGGKYNPSDAYGTSLLDYALKHGGSMGSAPAVAAINAAAPAKPQSLMGGIGGGISNLLGYAGKQAGPIMTSAQTAGKNAGPAIMRAALGSLAGRTALIDPIIASIFNGPGHANVGSGGYNNMTGSFNTTLNQGPVWQSSGPDHTSTGPIVDPYKTGRIMA